MILRGITKVIHKSLKSNRAIFCARYMCHKDDSVIDQFNNKTKDGTSPLLPLEKYKIFKDKDSPMILDVIEEKFKAVEQPKDEYQGLNLQRGKEGVFDIDDVVQLLKREKARNIFVVKVPQEFRYVNYIVIVSGKSVRHMKALAEFVKKVYKRKRQSRDLIPKIEGEDSKQWIAMDLGNIALHIFSEDARHIYDLESLWSLGAEFDELSQNHEDPLAELLQKHSVYLGDLQPANNQDR